MILVTVGMSEYNFDRLFKIIDELVDERIITDKKIVVQSGNSNYTSKNFESFDMIENEKFNKLVDDCDFIISHAGTGSVVPALKKNKKVIIFPRLEKFSEHLDNHQVELANLFLEKKYALVAYNKEQLIDCISKIKDFVPQKFISNNKVINDLIIDFIEK